MATFVRKPISVRATAEQHRLLVDAAALHHRSLNGFVLNAALEAADQAVKQTSTKPRRSREEIKAILLAAREEIQAANPTNRDLLAEFLAERRAEAACE